MTKLRGEVPFSPAGEQAFFQFTVSEVVGLEQKYGEDFFEKIELAARNNVFGVLTHCISTALKSRDANDRVTRIGEDIDNLPFHITEAALPILDAVSLAVANETYADLLKKIAEAQKEQVKKAAKEAKEAADEAGVPLSEEALVNAILRSPFTPG